MSDLLDFNRETRAERMARKERTEALISGARGRDGLTDAERRLLATLRAHGLDIRRSWLVNNEGIFEHDRAVVRRKS